MGEGCSKEIYVLSEDCSVKEHILGEGCVLERCFLGEGCSLEICVMGEGCVLEGCFLSESCVLEGCFLRESCTAKICLFGEDYFGEICVTVEFGGRESTFLNCEVIERIEYWCSAKIKIKVTPCSWDGREYLCVIIFDGATTLTHLIKNSAAYILLFMQFCLVGDELFFVIGSGYCICLKLFCFCREFERGLNIGTEVIDNNLTFLVSNISFFDILICKPLIN